MTWIEHDAGLIDDIASRMDLRAPNKAALRRIVEHIQAGDSPEVVCDLATGVGKTYITAAVVEYLATQGVRNVLIVTPGKTIQDKTIDNFTPGHPKYVPGGEYRPLLITSENFARGQVGDALHEDDTLKLFVFNVQQLIRPTAKTSRRVRETDEFVGGDLYGHLQATDDLVVIADEHHVYRTNARAFSSAVRDLGPHALIGLTAMPDPADEDKVIYRYTLAEAIADQLVKVPVIVYREDGHKDIETQLADACHLLRVKAAAYSTWAEGAGEQTVRPVLFVVCQNVDDTREVSNLLAGDGYIGDGDAVLEITNQSSDVALAALSQVEKPDSPIRAVVSVDKLKEGWDVKNIGVIVALRRLASQALTEQILGRGLRLPYGRRIGVPMVDQVDLVAHDSYRKLLQQKDALIQRIVPTGESAATGEPIEGAEEHDATVQRAAACVEERQKPGELRLEMPPRIVDGEQVDVTAGLILQEYGVAVGEGERDAASYKVLQRVPSAPQISFPRRERVVMPARFSLSHVDDVDARAAGAAFAQEIKIPLVREALEAHRTVGGDVDVRRVAQESETATQEWVPVSKVASDLESRIFDLGLVEQSTHELGAVERVVSAFLDGAGVSPDKEVDWSAERARQAVGGIGKLIEQKYAIKAMRPDFMFNTVTLPIEPRSMPTDVLDRYSDFERGRWYSGWRKSVLPIAAFDAKSTEYRLANILDSAPAIRWWLRLRAREDPGYVELDDGSKYYADFIAIDDQDVHWLIEGKADDQAEHNEVVKKRKAAEEWARFVNDERRFGVWRYLFCTETVIRNAHGSWDALRTGA